MIVNTFFPPMQSGVALAETGDECACGGRKRSQRRKRVAEVVHGFRASIFSTMLSLDTLRLLFRVAGVHPAFIASMIPSASRAGWLTLSPVPVTSKAAGDGLWMGAAVKARRPVGAKYSFASADRRHLVSTMQIVSDIPSLRYSFPATSPKHSQPLNPTGCTSDSSFSFVKKWSHTSKQRI